MRMRVYVIIVAAVGALSFQAGVKAARGADAAVTASIVKSEEMNQKASWLKRYLLGDSRGQAPFSFTYGGKPFDELLKTGPKSVETQALDEARTEHMVTWADAKTGLRLRCVVVEYADFPIVEWTLYVKNTGKADTPIIADVQALDIRVPSAEYTLHRTVGDGVAGMYSPDPIQLSPGDEKRFAPDGGRPCSSEFPYFNIEKPGSGMIFAIGWPGQWAAKFSRNAAGELRVIAGQELTHFKLLPGEELRSPMIVCEFWQGDHAHAQNIWRRWMIEHCLPKPNGKPVVPQMNVCNGNQYGLWGITEANQNAWIDRYREEGIDYDYWWCDLGWFSANTTTYIFNALYDPKPAEFPNGLKSLSDYLHKHKIKLIAWFEPEHYYPGPGNWICDHHPEWLLKAPPGHENEINQGMPLKNRTVLNLGDPEALKWVTNNIDRVIREQGIDLYRHDFNIEPLMFWRAADTPDRQGVTEIKYVTGFLAFFDELLRRHPGMLIDNCASGGRRNDVETLRRSIPLLRSDTWGEPVGQQCQTYGLANWIPFWGTGIIYDDPKGVAYIFRSQMGPSFSSGWDITPKGDYDYLRKLLAQWRSVRGHILYGDYYPLTPYSASNDAWMAWQYDRPELGEGVVQAFRRDKSPLESQMFKLRRLEPETVYVVTDLDQGDPTEMTGRELCEKGLPIVIKAQPGAVIVTYKKRP
jgi:alpha-galactosidase